MMKVVVPDAVEPVTLLFRRPDKLRLLRLVFRDDDDRPIAGSFAGMPRQRGEHVIVRFIIDVLRRIEPQPVEMKLGDPIAGVVNEQLADWAAFWAIEIDR